MRHDVGDPKDPPLARQVAGDAGDLQEARGGERLDLAVRQRRELPTVVHGQSAVSGCRR